MGHIRQPIEPLEPRRLLTADIDLAFGIPGRGKAFFNLGPLARIFATELQSDGKIVVAGSLRGDRDAFVARLTAAGAIDVSFGVAGVTKLDFGQGDYADDVKLLAGGKILVGGTTGSIVPNYDPLTITDESRRSFLIRLRPDGSVDTNSGFGGTSGIVFGNAGEGGITAMTIAGGKLYTVGEQTVRRYILSSGAFDLTFGAHDGAFDAYKDTEIYKFFSRDIDVSPTTGRVAVVGYALTRDQDEPDYSGPYVTDNECVVLLDSHGALVKSFGGNGVRFDGSTVAAGIRFAPDGATLLVPSLPEDHGSPHPLRMVKFKPDGSFTFREDPVSTGGPFDIAVGPGGKLYVACRGDGLEILRYNTDGTLDKSYSKDGLAAAVGDFDSYGGGTAIDPAGNVIFAGNLYGNYPDPGSPVAVRFLANPTGGGVTVSLGADGTLLITGTTGDDSIIARFDYSPYPDPPVPQIVANHDPFELDLAKIKRVQVTGRAGNDRIVLGDYYSGDLVLDVPTTIDGGDGNDDLRHNSKAADSLIGGAGNDTLTGGAAGDTLVGGDGNDSLAGDVGDDSLLGGYGNDTLNPGNGSDIVSGGHGRDTVFCPEELSVQWDGVNVTLDGVADDGNPGRRGNYLADIEVLVGTRWDDVLIGNGAANTLYGNEGVDTIQGGGGNDWLDGGSDADFIDGGAGNDLLLGDGVDVLDYHPYGTAKTRPHNDTLLGGDGADTLWGAGGNDRLAGQNGYDRLHGQDGKDALDGGAGNDSLWGEAGSDALAGGEGDDSLDGGSGNDTLVGQSGADLLTGGAGDDHFFAGGDSTSLDHLIGGSGSDRAATFDAADLLESIEFRAAV